MVVEKVPVKAYGVFQGLIFVVVVVTFVLFRKRARMREEDVSPRLSASDFRATIHRAGPPPGGRQQEAPGEKPGKAPEQIGSALPTWTKGTPAHEILGIAANADAATVEAAYKKLLKMYHPDRFASWGKAYQNRAHRVVLLLQDARAAMLGGRSGRR